MICGKTMKFDDNSKLWGACCLKCKRKQLTGFDKEIFGFLHNKGGSIDNV